MNYSIYSADRATHLKVVIMALLAAVAVAGVGLSLHLCSKAGAEVAVTLKAGKPVVMSNSVAILTR